jgi:hypothetical protein
MRLHVPYSVGSCGYVFYDYRVTYSHDYLFAYDQQSYGGVQIYDWSKIPIHWHINFHVPSHQTRYDR